MSSTSPGLGPLDDEYVFEPDGDRWVPRPIAAGPWDPRALHGGPPSALVGRLALAHEAGDAGWFPVRLTVDLIRPVPLAPLRVAVDIVRPGRRVQVLDAVVTGPDGVEVMWARMLRMARIPNRLDESAVPSPTPPAVPGPEGQAPWGLRLDLGWTAFGSAFEFRRGHGDPFVDLGPGALWSRLRIPLLAGQSVHPLDRVLTLADFANGIGAAVPFDRFSYINPDLTVSLHRLPVDDWVLLDSFSHARDQGHGVAEGRLADRDGTLGTALQSLLIADR